MLTLTFIDWYKDLGSLRALKACKRVINSELLQWRQNSLSTSIEFRTTSINEEHFSSITVYLVLLSWTTAWVHAARRLVSNRWNRELTLKCKFKCYFEPMNNPHSYVPLVSNRIVSYRNLHVKGDLKFSNNIPYLTYFNKIHLLECIWSMMASLFLAYQRK